MCVKIFLKEKGGIKKKYWFWPAATTCNYVFITHNYIPKKTQTNKQINETPNKKKTTDVKGNWRKKKIKEVYQIFKRIKISKNTTKEMVLFNNRRKFVRKCLLIYVDVTCK